MHFVPNPVVGHSHKDVINEDYRSNSNSNRYENSKIISHLESEMYIL